MKMKMEVIILKGDEKRVIPRERSKASCSSGGAVWRQEEQCDQRNFPVLNAISLPSSLITCKSLELHK